MSRPQALIPLTRPVLGESECAAVSEVLLSGWVTQGPVVERFEKAVAEYVGAAHGVAVASGTAALHLALLAAGVGPGDEVIVPSLTFIATANAVRHCGARPVFADVERDTYNLDPASVGQRISPRTKAILAVHQFGRPANLAAIAAISDRHGCVLIEDAACALGSAYRGHRIGSHSSLVCFSFHPRKVITTGEGGMITTSDGSLAGRLRRLRHHGMNISDWQRHAEASPVRERFEEVGFNYRLSDLAAAVGVRQMERLEGLVQTRRRLAAAFDDAFADHPALEVPAAEPESEWNGQTYALCLSHQAPLDVGGLIGALRRRGIGARHGLACIHHEPSYAGWDRTAVLPTSEWLSERMFLLPLFPEMTPGEHHRVIDAVASVLDESAARPGANRFSDMATGTRQSR